MTWFYSSQEDVAKGKPNKILAQGKEFIINGGIKPPTINSLFLLEHSKVNKGEEVLDIGTGSGFHAVFAAEKAKRVVATDIYPPAVENAKLNAQKHGVADKIDFRIGDLFAPIKKGEKFDVIYFNVAYPFSDADQDRWRLHERLFAEIRDYMKPKGRIYYQVGFVRNISFIYDMLNRNHFQIMEMHMINAAQYHREPIFMMIQSR
jgi:methylase of polypeptide subunit release factors